MEEVKYTWNTQNSISYADESFISEVGKIELAVVARGHGAYKKTKKSFLDVIFKKSIDDQQINNTIVNAFSEIFSKLENKCYVRIPTLVVDIQEELREKVNQQLEKMGIEFTELKFDDIRLDEESDKKYREIQQSIYGQNK